MARRRRVSGPQNLKAPTQIVPADQLAPYYGGDVGFQRAKEMAELQQQMDRQGMSQRLQNLFPPVEYDRYDIPVTMQPGVSFSNMPGSYMNPGGLDPTVMSNMRYGTEPVLPQEMIVDPMDTDQFSWLAQNVERPLTQGLLDDPLYPAAHYGIEEGDIDPEALYQADQDMESRQKNPIGGSMGTDEPLAPEDFSPSGIDQTLAQLRRHGGDYGLSDFDAKSTLDNAVADAQSRVAQGEYMGSEAIPQSGITLAQLIAMTRLPKQVQKFLPERMSHLLGVGGVAAGMGASQQRQQPTMNANATMGPLTGLY
jgi:hypothetical protein